MTADIAVLAANELFDAAALWAGDYAPIAVGGLYDDTGCGVACHPTITVSFTASFYNHAQCVAICLHMHIGQWWARGECVRSIRLTTIFRHIVQMHHMTVHVVEDHSCWDPIDATVRVIVDIPV